MPRTEDRPSPLVLLQRYQGLAGLGALFIVAAFVSKDFFTGANFVNVLRQLAVPGTLAIGMTIVILTAGIDLSVGSHLALLNVLIAMSCKSGHPIWATSTGAIVAGAAIGGLTGWLVGATRLQPFVVTLAAMVTLRGVSYTVSKGSIVSGIGPSIGVFQEPLAGVPASGWLFVAASVVAAVLLSKSVFGRRVFAIGGNEVASKLSGVPVNRVRIGAYAFNGACVGLAALLFTARTNTGQPSAAQGYELDAIAAVVVGGASLMGGIGNVFGTVVGALFMSCVNNLLQLQGVDFYVAMGWKGLIILLAVYLQNLGRSH